MHVYFYLFIFFLNFNVMEDRNYLSNYLKTQTFLYMLDSSVLLERLSSAHLQLTFKLGFIFECSPTF